MIVTSKKAIGEHNNYFNNVHNRCNNGHDDHEKNESNIRLFIMEEKQRIPTVMGLAWGFRSTFGFMNSLGQFHLVKYCKNERVDRGYHIAPLLLDIQKTFDMMQALKYLEKNMAVYWVNSFVT